MVLPTLSVDEYVGHDPSVAPSCVRRSCFAVFAAAVAEACAWESASACDTALVADPLPE